MTEKATIPLFEKVGRKYVPMAAYWHEHSNVDQMQAGTFRLVYAHGNGCKRYEYAVTPATAPTVAAMLIAKTAMVDAIREASKMRPNVETQYTKKQLALIAKFREDMGMAYPSWWVEGSAYDIADAAVKAVLEFKP